MEERFLDRDDRPPRSGPAFEIKRLKAHAAIHICILAPIWATWTHWNGRSSEPCFKDHKQCNGHKRGYPRRWKGYVHCVDTATGDEVFLELTPLACHGLLAQLGRNTPLRGQRMRVKRGGGDRARLEIVVSPPHPEPDTLPAPKTPFFVLCKLWGLDREDSLDGGKADFVPDE